MRNLSVVIPSKNASNFIACAQTVRQHEPSINIVLVDDGIGYQNRPRGPHLRPFYFINGDKPFIFSRNVNIGITFCGDDDVIVLNDDALLQSPGGFTLLQKTAEEHPEYGVIAATTNRVGNRNQYRLDNGGLRTDPRMVCFVGVLIPRRTIETVGLLDEEFTGYGYEDDSYCLRVRRAGLKIGIHDGCFLDHASLPSSFRNGESGYPNEAFEYNAQVFERKYGAPNHAL